MTTEDEKVRVVWGDTILDDKRGGVDKGPGDMIVRGGQVGDEARPLSKAADAYATPANTGEQASGPANVEGEDEAPTGDRERASEPSRGGRGGSSRPSER